MENGLLPGIQEWNVGENIQVTMRIRQSSSWGWLGQVVTRAFWVLMVPCLAGVISAADAADPAAPAAGGAPIRAPGTVSLFARVQAIDAVKNSFTASNASSIFLVHCSASTLSKVGGAVVKASDLKVGADVAIRGRVEADGSIAAFLLATRVATPAPGMKPSVPKDKDPKSPGAK